VNTEERQLADMLRRVAPEPPRRVTVEDVAFRLANQAGGSGRRRHREPRAQRGGWGWGRGWASVLAAASVFVVAGASAGVVEVMTSHHAPASSGNLITPTSPPAPTHSATATQGPSSTGQPTWPPERVASGVWGAELITHDTFNQDSLTSGNGSLYAISGDYLDRIDPATGDVVDTARASTAIANLPIVTGNTVWLVSSYAGSSVVLDGYDGQTLAQVASVTVPVTGQASTTAGGVLTTGSGGYLYVAAGRSVVVLNPSTRQVVKQISVPAGPVGSVAVSPDGSRLYVSIGTVELLTYSLATDTQVASSAITDLTSSAGNLVATAGGVWGTAGVGMSEWTWFAPDGDLARAVRIGVGAGAGLSSIPSVSGGTVWIGGSHTLACASPVTGEVLRSVTIPTDGGVVEYFGSATLTGGRTYALYLDNRSQQAGVVTLTPPAACSG
jgi:YVTN family beta-propeller protein